MAMSRREAMMRALHALLVAMLLALGQAALPAQAQDRQAGANPTASSPPEQQLLQELTKLQGRITIPNAQAATLEQPQGREYQTFHERILPWVAAIIIVGMLVILAAFYLWRGRIRLRPDERSDHTIARFNALERFTHWLTATSFIVLAITGLNYFYGKRLVMPLFGPDAFATWSYWAKYAHNFVAWPFMLGVLLMLMQWLRDNLPDRADAVWLRQGGGFFNRSEPPAGRFNAGQKLVFWSVVLFGIALSVTGIVLLFPFWFVDVNGMQIMQYVHSTVAVIMIAIILAHIYIGTLGMEGAYEAMWSGQVSVGWARHHHRLWVERQQATPQVARGPAPAE
jgi:formate dehydrogenase subunit gamma